MNIFRIGFSFIYPKQKIEKSEALQGDAEGSRREKMKEETPKEYKDRVMSGKL